MTRILVAVDGSRRSGKVIDHAVGLAKSLSAEILLLYVVPVSPIPDEYLEYARMEGVNIKGYYDLVARRILADLGRSIAEKKIDFESSHRVGIAAIEIARVARLEKVDMIVLGLRGLHGLAKVRALGSTARRVIERSTVPVVVVPS